MEPPKRMPWTAPARDKPLPPLDPPTEDQIQKVLRQIQHDHGGLTGIATYPHAEATNERLMHAIFLELEKRGLVTREWDHGHHIYWEPTNVPVDDEPDEIEPGTEDRLDEWTAEEEDCE